MSVISAMADYVTRRRRMRSVTSVARRYSRQAFPEDHPVWSMVAEVRPHECVVYVTYERKEPVTAPAPHRFFKVELPNLSVTALQEDYYPAQWGPCH